MEPGALNDGRTPYRRLAWVKPLRRRRGMMHDWVPLCVLCFAAASCATVQTTSPGAVGIQRKQTMLVSEASVEQGAAKAYATQLEQAQQQGKLNADPELTARVRRISQRLIPVTASFRPDAPDWHWEINAMSTPEMNAYAMPGGKIMVYSGLVDQLQLSDAELAAVLGHEISHALREHTRERVSRAYAEQIALTGIALAVGAPPGTVDLASSVAKMQAASTGHTPQFLSTHPSSANRINEIERHVPEVEPLYQQAAAQHH
jgi:predicted Zn-dependent protease